MKNNEIKMKNEERKNVKLRQTKRSIYTNDMLDEIRSMTDNHELTRNELLAVLHGRYPDKKITTGNLNNVISRYGIRFKACARGRYSGASALDEDLINQLILNPFYQEGILDTDVSGNNIDDTSENCNQEEDDTAEMIFDEGNITKPIDELNEPQRFEPIRAEVHSVFSNWFNDKNCNVQKDFQTIDYINMLENLVYLAENVDYIIQARCDQHDIANCYQSDVLHEQENVVLEDGNTYLSDKMHVIRNCRRFIEYDSNNMNAMKNMLHNINVAELKSVLQVLQKYEELRKHPVFIPMIDKAMVDKYDWAIEGSDKYGKLANKPILVTNNKRNKRSINNTRNSKNSYFKAFSINAKLMDDAEEFVWERRYYCVSSADALLRARADINKQLPGAKILNMECN